MYIAIALFTGLLVGWVIGKQSITFSKEEARLFGAKGRAVQRERAERRKARILALAVEKGRIVNDDAEDLFCISDSTANRYLRELVRKGKLEKHGDGRSTYYTPL